MNKNKWNFECDEDKLSQNGYEEFNEKLLNYYTNTRYNSANDLIKEQLINEVFEIYRGKNIFPIDYYSFNGIKNGIMKARNYSAKLKIIEGQKILNTGAGVGVGVNNFLFKNMYQARNINDKFNAIEKFEFDKKLKTAIRFAMEFDKNASPKAVMGGIRMQGAMPSNFRPMNAKLLYERYTKENGTIFDYAMGFGGRMFGAVSSIKNFKYIGVDPNPDTFRNLKILKEHLKNVLKRNDDDIKIYQECSENFKLPPNSIDFSFSSPPYFNLEIYTEDDNQSYNKFDNLELWFEKYLKVTIENIYTALKNDTFFGINIADFKHKGKDIKVVDRVFEICKNIGFDYYETLSLKIPSRTNRKQNDKKEGIFIFKKGNPEIQKKTNEQLSLF